MKASTWLLVGAIFLSACSTQLQPHPEPRAAVEEKQDTKGEGASTPTFTHRPGRGLTVSGN